MLQETAWHELANHESRNREQLTHSPLIFRWRLAYHAAKSRAERAYAFIPHFETDFGYRQPVACQEALSPFDAEPCDKLVRGLSERARKQPVVMVRREICFAGRIGQAKRLVQSRRQIVARPAQTPEEFAVNQRSEPLRRGEYQRMGHA